MSRCFDIFTKDITFIGGGGTMFWFSFSFAGIYRYAIWLEQWLIISHFHPLPPTHKFSAPHKNPHPLSVTVYLYKYFDDLTKDLLCFCRTWKQPIMNGEIPSVPITTLAGVCSLTDCKYFIQTHIVYFVTFLDCTSAMLPTTPKIWMVINSVCYS